VLEIPRPCTEKILHRTTTMLEVFEESECRGGAGVVVEAVADAEVKRASKGVSDHASKEEIREKM
jgi:hypothetical protein